jgi:opacity protein-like surface antigen
MKALVLVATGALLAVSLAAGAQPYIGASLGASSAPARCEEDLTRRCEGNMAALRGFLGYGFTRQLAIEAGVTGVESSAALDLSAIGSVALGERVALFGRLGAFTADRYTNLTVGAGLRFDVGENAALRLEWQHFEGGNGLDVLFVGIMRRF